MYQRGKIALCRDCLADKMPDCCIGCAEWGDYEQHPCSWCTRNADRILKDMFRKWPEITAVII